MKSFSFLLFTLLIIFSIQDDFSIKKMISYLDSKGYYDLLLDIKTSFGVDIAINCCKKFASQYQSKCGEAVKNYIVKRDVIVISIYGKDSIFNKSLNEIKKEFNALMKKIKATQNFKNSIKLMFSKVSQNGKVIINENLKVYDILRKKKTEGFILKYIEKKVKRYKLY